MVRQDERTRFVAGLRGARERAFGPGEYVGQESFMTATEIRRLGDHAGVGPGVSVLDLCCGIAGPGRLLAADRGCDYVGVDYSASALAIARQLAAGLPCRFVQGRVPPLPRFPEPFDVMLLLETLLAFEDKRELLAAIASALRPGGRLALTVEAGTPLTAIERATMPDADTVWLIELDDLLALLDGAGLEVERHDDVTEAHLRTATDLLAAFGADVAAIEARIGVRALDELIAAHELWCAWMGTGRVRKHAVVARRR